MRVSIQDPYLFLKKSRQSLNPKVKKRQFVRSLESRESRGSIVHCLIGAAIQTYSNIGCTGSGAAALNYLINI